jgi:hypothetical protein
MTKRRSKRSIKRKTYRRLNKKKTSKRRNTRRRRSIRRRSIRRNKMRGGSFPLQGVKLPKNVDYHPDEYLIERGQEDLFTRLLRMDERKEIPFVIASEHSELLGKHLHISGNFQLPLPEIFFLTGTNIGNVAWVKGDLKSHTLDCYKQLDVLGDILSTGGISSVISDSGCVDPRLLRKDVNPAVFENDVSINFKLYGRHENIEEVEDLPEVLSEEELEMASMTPDILQKYFVNDMLLRFTREEYFRQFGLLAELQIQGVKIKVRFCLTTGEEKWSANHEITQKKLSDVFGVINRLRTNSDKIFVAYLNTCRVYDSPLQKQLSKKTDKSKTCWFETYNTELNAVTFETDKKEKLIKFLEFFENMGELYNLFTQYDLDQLVLFQDRDDKMNIASLVVKYSDYQSWFEETKSKLPITLKDRFNDILDYESFNQLLELMGELELTRGKSLELLKELYAGNIEKIKELIELLENL